MKEYLVKDWMTKTPITIGDHATLPDAYALMKEKKVRRLPVVDSHQKLVGIISTTDVKEASPSEATTLSIQELNYLLAKLQVKKIMTTPVRTVTPDQSVADVARAMLDYKIGGMPVVDENEHVVGIITESDIFRMVVQLYAD